ncbi:hypothetical protein LNX60_24055, partial [Klebsiella pneumoniae]|nr:hypothetical protein [Klebsiella pneumoniae]
VFAGKKSAQIREILINESAWEEMTCLFALSLSNLNCRITFLRRMAKMKGVNYAQNSGPNVSGS